MQHTHLIFMMDLAVYTCVCLCVCTITVIKGYPLRHTKIIHIALCNCSCDSKNSIFITCKKGKI